MDFQVSHIYREVNRVTDSLASHAISLNSETWWFSPPYFIALLVDDFMGRHSYHFL